MAETVISVENLSKSYRFGQIGTGMLTNDLKVWWAKKTDYTYSLHLDGYILLSNREFIIDKVF